MATEWPKGVCYDSYGKCGVGKCEALLKANTMNCKQFEKIDPSKQVRRRLRPVFDLAGARRMLPLVNAILKEVAERSVAIAHHETKTRRAAASPTNPRLATLFAVRDYSDVHRRERQNTIDELQRLGVKLLDPVRGIAGFPTVVNGALAYFVHEVGNSELMTWRYRNESKDRTIPVEWKCRSL